MRTSRFVRSLRIVRHLPRVGLLAGFVLSVAPVGRAATVTLRPSKDTTIYGDGSANLSNGAGTFLLVGSSGEKRVLRSLVAFNLSGQIPAGSTINAVTLTLAINTPLNANANTVQLRRLLADWGEGTSVPSAGGGGGAQATPGDATWRARFFNTTNWTTPGGDFSPTVSASQRVSGSSGSAGFSGAGLVADVQAWVDAPSGNFGWILVAQDESGAAVRFSSREGSAAPLLVVDFTPGTGGGGNAAPVFTTQPTAQTVAVGSSVTFTAAASGSPAPTFQWRRNNVPISGATGASLILSTVTATDAGSYSVVAANAAGSVTSSGATLTIVDPTGSTARLANLSVRAAMSAGQILIVGFSVSGGNRPILVRGVGPTLANFGLDGSMVDPRLELYSGTALIAQNDDWGDSPTLSAVFVSVGAFALTPGSRDAALLQTVDGSRSAQLKGTGAGVVLVELYDAGVGASGRLVNVSARNQVGTGDNILILGFVIDGSGAKNILIRAIGPRLADLGVGGVLADPKFEVFRSGNATAIASNDNWEASLAPTFTSVGAFGLVTGSKDAALVTALVPGSYTVQVSGANGGIGEALVEIYEVP